MVFANIVFAIVNDLIDGQITLKPQHQKVRCIF